MPGSINRVKTGNLRVATVIKNTETAEVAEVLPNGKNALAFYRFMSKQNRGETTNRELCIHADICLNPVIVNGYICKT